MIWTGILLLSIGWSFLFFTSASLLLPNQDAAWDRLNYGINFASAKSLDNVILRLNILFHVMSSYLVILPLASYLWMIDEVFFGGYNDIQIQKPVITISVPRGGTTSFHRTLALDERFATPTMAEVVMPFICVYKLLFALNQTAPGLVQKTESLLKWINRVTPQVEARHPISLFAPDADDILLGERHWVSVGAVRTFPVAEYWKKHYQMDAHSSRERDRSMQLHRRMCQKVLYNRPGPRRLLLRSHLSPCVGDFQRLYPDAVAVGILRNPVDVLQSFAGLSTEAVLAATGVNMLAPAAKDSIWWPSLFRALLADMMDRESALYGGDDDHAWKGRCHYVTFSEFKANPQGALGTLYGKMELSMTPELEDALQNGLKRHETYKTRHTYKNPTLDQMMIDEKRFLNLPGVKRYAELLEEQSYGR
ncbi:expressed unknown protein [Seminavis robusta]|uniref:Sulfotransferase n=1 Tax=Seminavis robusta TaxID=568900 RepID=A0A9N8EBV9_9STRA|nr:expressed unknown protein [Seminavis robusta]|eukprot:Sro781_g201640.1 n/a (421) ;mRNA; f:35950-37212